MTNLKSAEAATVLIFNSYMAITSLGFHVYARGASVAVSIE